MALITPFQLLELNVISGQDLAPVTRKMRTYAIAWVHPDRKLSTRVDPHGHTNPTWNDKFVFRVDDEFLHNDTSAVMVEIYAQHWFRDVHVGTVRVLVGNLIPPPSRLHHHNNHHLGMRFVALQVRRHSGRPQGILNIGVALLDSSMRSMPLYRQLSASAVGYRDLMGEEDPHNHHNPNHNHNQHNSSNNNNNGNVVAVVQQTAVKPILRRSRSERSERDRPLPYDDELSQKQTSTINGSELVKAIVARSRASSMVNGSEVEKGKRKKARSRASSMVDGIEAGEIRKRKSGRASSLISGSETGDLSKKNTNGVEPKELTKKVANERPNRISNVSEVVDPPKGKATTENPVSKTAGLELGAPKKEVVINGKPFSKPGFEFGAGQKGNFPHGSFWSESEVGPSPSEVAAAVAEMYPVDEGGSSVLGGWSMDESVEGLRSKLERWRTELPPVYDRGGDYGSFRSTGGQHVRRHTDGGGGLFSCFGNVYGYECSCICGKPAGTPTTPGRKKGNSGRVHLSPSVDSENRSYV